MGQVETKIFENAPPWDGESVTSRTDLDEKTVDGAWKVWCKSVMVKGGKVTEENFFRMLDLKDEQAEEKDQAARLFELLDRDDDQKLGI